MIDLARRAIAVIALIAAVVGVCAFAYAATKVDPANLPIGDGKYSTTTPQRGYVYLCHASGGGPGAAVDGPWIDGDGTWNSTTKATVDGEVEWPEAFASIQRSGSRRIVTSNDLPTNHATGTFPNCQGHPNMQGYHYHSIPTCLYDGESKNKQSGLVGFAYDGFPIYGPRGRDGKLLTNADLDVCHGTTSKVRLDGKKQRIYHYVATLEYPYTVGCYRGTEIAAGVPR